VFSPPAQYTLIMIITGQQKIMLNKWQNGLLKNKDVYKFLASRINEIPNDIINNGTDEEAIIFLYKKCES